ncbi:MAG: AtpZ/AtpI family protein [Chloroflexota bacterium]|nr:AtpZ/AtpI family protein [Chloroflexota bacterium]
MKTWPAAMQLLAVGFYVALSLIIPTGIGLWFDHRADHGFPWLTLCGLALGTIIMAYGVYRMMKPFFRQAKEEGREDQLYRPMKKLFEMTSREKEGEKEEHK